MFNDAEADHRDGISSKDGAGFVGLAIDAGDFAEPDEVAVLAAFESELAEVLGCFKCPVGADGEGAFAGFDGAGGEFDVFGDKGLLDIRDSKSARGEGAAVDPDAHCPGLVAAHLHAGHAVEHGEAVHQIPAGVVAEFGNRESVADEVEPKDDIVVGIDFLDFRRIGLLGEVVENGGDAVADVVRCGVDVAVGAEGDGDFRAAVFAGGFDEVDAFDAGDAFLDGFGDAGLDDIGRSSAVGGFHRDDGRVDVRKLAQGQALEGDHAEGDEQEREDGGEDRALDGKVGEQHQSTFAGLASVSVRMRTGAPSESLNAPWATIFSPGERPSRISTSP